MSLLAADARVAADDSEGDGAAADAVELAPGGAHIPVTASNREEFVRRFAVHALVGAVAAPLDAFVRGFRRVRGPALGLFHRRGARALIRGEPNWTWRHFDA